MRTLTVHAVAALLALIALAGAALAEPIRSGPQVGEKVPGPFKPLNVNGPEAGQKACLYCRFGPRPVVMVFAREVTPVVRALIQRLEAVTAANSDSEMRSAVIVCSDSENLAGQLAELVRQDRLNNVTLAVYKTTGPTTYNLAAEADLTVLMYTHAEVKVNHAFRKGEFTVKHIDWVLAGVPQILSAR